MPRVRTASPKPPKAPKAAAPKARTATPKAAPAPKPVAVPKPAALTTKVALRAPNTRATNPLITKAINARKKTR